jgi:hypothetical protein
MLFQVVPCTMYVSCSVMGLYPVHGHVISRCSVYNVCEQFRDGIISSTWSCYFTLFRVQCLWAALWWDYIQYMVMLFHVVPCTMSVNCSVMDYIQYMVMLFHVVPCTISVSCPVMDYIQYMVMLFHVVPCTMSVSCTVMGLYPVHGHVISRCSVYTVCELLRDGIISSTWSCYFTLFRVMSVSCSVITFSSTRCYITFNHVHSLCAVSLYFYFNMCDSLCVIFFLSLFLSTAILNVIVANVWTLD